MKTRMFTAAVLAATAGQAIGQTPPAIDGVLETSFYGSTPLWVQNQPTSRGDNSTLACDPCAVGAPAAVSTGVEIAIPLAAIGNPSPANIRVTAFVNGQGQDFLSNQISGAGLPCPSDNLGNPRNLDFSAIVGNQFFANVGAGFTAPTLNGSIVGENTIFSYGAAKFVQSNRTGFGDSNLGLPGQANGSELSAGYATVVNNTLYIFLSGNLETNNNKLAIFIDSVPGVGQNQLIANNPGQGGLLALAANSDPQQGAVGPGLKFDAGFDADYFISIGNNFDGATSTYNLYVDYARLSGVSSPTDPGEGFYVGGATAPQGNGVLSGGSAPVGSPIEAIQVSIDNSNTAGVLGTCPPSGGNPAVANGSELDNAYGRILGNRLYLFVGGNLANNFDKLQLFFDAEAGGQNAIRNDNPDVDFNALNRMGFGSYTPPSGIPQDGALTFDTGFEADYWLNVGNGNGSSAASIQVFANAAVMRTNGQLLNGGGFPLDYGAFDGGGRAGLPSGQILFAGPLLQAQPGTEPQPRTSFAPRSSGRSLLANPNAPVGATGKIVLTIDNSNLGGVGAVPPAGTGSVAGAAAVATGVELAIELDELSDCGQTGNPPCSSINSVRVAGLLTYGDAGASTVSNQVIGGLPAVAELGEVRSVNFANVAGNQFITVTRSAGTSTCYANCDGSTNVPVLNAIDFSCFLNRYRAGDAYANCDGSTNVPQLNAIDFSCFLSRYRAPEAGTNCTN